MEQGVSLNFNNNRKKTNLEIKKKNTDKITWKINNKKTIQYIIIKLIVCHCL